MSHVAALGWIPLLPLWLLVVLGAVSLLALAAGLIRRASGTIWRAAATALLLLWLAGPHLLRATWQSLPETALLVIDRTGSMQVGARAAVAERAASNLRAQAAALRGITLNTVIVPPDPQAGGTRLFDAIARASADIPTGQLAGIIALTDGQVHDRPAPTTVTNTAPPPLHVLIPAASEQKDRRLRILQAPPYAIIGHDATLRVEIDDLGAAPNTHDQALLTLKRDGETPISRSVPVGLPQDITLPVDHPGPMLVALSAAAWPGEVSLLNNQAVVQINGVRDRLRVLLVSGTPNQGERVWRRLLKADPAVDLVHFTILRPPDKDDTTPLNELALIAFPTRELFQEKINGFDLIILDGFENRGILPLGYLQNIADFVRGGGGLLLTAGPEFVGRYSLQDTPLGDILPAHVPSEGGLIEQQFQPTPTSLGRLHPVTADLPLMPPAPGANPIGQASWGPWYRALRPDQSHGETLLTSPDGQGGTSPLLVLDHVDQGRTAMLLSDQIWLWSRGQGGGGPQAELLRRIAHWLMKEPQLEEEQLSATLAHGTLSVTRRSVDPHPASRLTVIAPGGQRAALSLSARPDGTLGGTLDASAAGIWEVTDGTLHAFAASQPTDPTELSDLRATATKLKPFAASIGWLGDDATSIHLPALRIVPEGAATSGHGWIGLRRTGAHIVTGTQSHTLLPAWLVLPLLLALLFIGWWREGRRL